MPRLAKSASTCGVGSRNGDPFAIVSRPVDPSEDAGRLSALGDETPVTQRPGDEKIDEQPEVLRPPDLAHDGLVLSLGQCPAGSCEDEVPSGGFPALGGHGARRAPPPQPCRGHVAL